MNRVKNCQSQTKIKDNSRRSKNSCSSVTSRARRCGSFPLSLKVVIMYRPAKLKCRAITSHSAPRHTKRRGSPTARIAVFGHLTARVWAGRRLASFDWLPVKNSRSTETRCPVLYTLYSALYVIQTFSLHYKFTKVRKVHELSHSNPWITVFIHFILFLFCSDILNLIPHEQKIRQTKYATLQSLSFHCRHRGADSQYPKVICGTQIQHHIHYKINPIFKQACFKFLYTSFIVHLAASVAD